MTLEAYRQREIDKEFMEKSALSSMAASLGIVRGILKKMKNGEYDDCFIPTLDKADKDYVRSRDIAIRYASVRSMSNFPRRVKLPVEIKQEIDKRRNDFRGFL